MTSEFLTPSDRAMPVPRAAGLVAVSMVKNEADIIELFIRINARVVDAFYVIDHNSDDGTPAILNALIREGFPIHLSRLADLHYRPAENFTALARDAARAHPGAYVVPLDADEFLASETADSPAQVIASRVEDDGWGQVPWRTYCMTSDRYFEQPAPLFHLFRARQQRGQEMSKVVLGNTFAQHCTLRRGNHSGYIEGVDCTPVALPLIIQHAPIRSREQFLRKVITGTHIRALRGPRLGSESFHYYDMIDRLRAMEFEVGEQDLLDIALNYSTQPDQQSALGLEEDGPRIGDATDVITMPELAKVGLLTSLDKMLSGLVSMNLETREALKAATAELTRCLDQTKHERMHLEERLEAARRQRDDALGIIDELKASTSWRLTKPLRSLSRLLL